jgi:hypothetical protein
MALQGPFAVIANEPPRDVVEALRAAGAYPIIEARWAAADEHVGVIGALTVESAARALKSRDIDGMIIGEGFDARVVEALLTVLAEEARFRDLPVAVVGNHTAVLETFAARPRNFRRGAAQSRASRRRRAKRHRISLALYSPPRLCSPLKRMLACLDARGAIDPDTGLLAHAVFWRDLNRAVDDAKKRGAALSIARFSLPAADRRSGLEAARVVGRLMRQVDFACQEADKSIFTVFTETDLRAAHVVTRRIASVLNKVTLAADGKAGLEPAVTLATLKPSDTTDSLIARVVEEPPQPA